MRDVEVGRIARTLRRRRGWRQDDVAARAGVHRSTVSLVERGRLAGLTVLTIRRCLDALEARLEFHPRWHGAELDRLLDEAHSRLQAAWKERLERWGWLVIAEASFNHYGDRGRVDLLAWHPLLRILLVIEVKTLIADVQGLLGPLDVKLRLSASIALERGWGRPLAIVPILILLESSSNRRRLASLAPLFSRFNRRGRSAATWLRHPGSIPSGLLILTGSSPATGERVKRVGRQRVRVDTAHLSVDGSPPGPRTSSRVT